MVLESACIPIPSEITMPVGGLLASQGKLWLPLVILDGTLANLAGSLISYYVGRGDGRAPLLPPGAALLLQAHSAGLAGPRVPRHEPPAPLFPQKLPQLRTLLPR